MLDRTQSLSRKVEHLPTKLSVQSHQLHLTVVFSINRWGLLKIQPENQFSETNGKNQEWTSGLAQESQHNTTAQTQRSLPPPSSEVGCTSIFKLNQGSHCGPHLRPAATCARASQSSGSSTSCISSAQMKRQTVHFEVAECFHGGWWVIKQ